MTIGVGSTSKFRSRCAMCRAVALSIEGEPLWQWGRARPPAGAAAVASANCRLWHDVGWGGTPAFVGVSWLVFQKEISETEQLGQSKPMARNHLDLGASRLLTTFSWPLQSLSLPCLSPWMLWSIPAHSVGAIRVWGGRGGCTACPPSLSCASKLSPCHKEGGSARAAALGKTSPVGKPHPAARR